MHGHTLIALGVAAVLAGGPPVGRSGPASGPGPQGAGPTGGIHGSSVGRLVTLLGDKLAAQLAADQPRTRQRSDLDEYRVRTQPGAMTRFWVGGAIDRLLHFLTPTSRIPMLGVAHFSVLSTIPVAGEHSSDFGFRVHPISKRRKLHTGLDFAADRGTRVRAAGPGTVTFAGRRGTYGNLVIISHGLGLETRYAHLHRIKVERERLVTAGTVIGTVGSTGRSTGPHLHFEVRQFGEPLDPKWALGLRTPSLLDELKATWSWLVDH